MHVSLPRIGKEFSVSEKKKRRRKEANDRVLPKKSIYLFFFFFFVFYYRFFHTLLRGQHLRDSGTQEDVHHLCFR